MLLPMFIGRVVLPAGGFVVLAIAVTWQSVKSITADAGAGPVRLHRSRRPGRCRGSRRKAAWSPIPAACVTVGTEVLGTIISMPVVEKATVHKGDLLVELRSEDGQGRLAGGPLPTHRGRSGLAAGTGPQPVGPHSSDRGRQGDAAS